MIVHVRNSSTLKNLNQLRSYILRHPGQDQITVLLDPLTGEMNLPQPIQEFDFSMAPSKKNRKGSPEQIKLSMRLGAKGVEFELLDDSDRKANLKNINPHAYLVLNETLKILNQLLGPLYKSVTELFEHLDAVKMELANEIQVRKEWHPALSRAEAEDLLENQPIGTYLLREGDLETQEFEESFLLSNQQPFRCYVVTFVGEGGKISDRLLIQQREGWAVYDDEPDLNTYTYQKDLSQVLRSIGAKWPYA